MVDRLKQLSGGVAWGMTMPGPRPVFGPNDGTGTGESKEGEGDGEQGGDGGGGSDGDKGGGENQSARRLGGLFARRGGDDGAKGDPAGTGEGVGGTGEDGRPEGLSDKFWDPKGKTVKADALIKAYTDLEKAHGTLKRSKSIGGEIPENEADYFGERLELPPEVDRIDVPIDDPGLKAAAKVFKKYGIGKDAAPGIVKDFLVEMNEHMPAPVDPEQEYKALGKGADAVIDGVFVWLDGGAQSGDFSEDDMEIAEGLAKTAQGMRFLAKMRQMSGEAPIPIMPGTGSRGMSAEQWNSEFKEAVKAGDYKRQEELEEMGKIINGTDVSYGGRPGGFTAEKTIARR